MQRKHWEMDSHCPHCDKVNRVKCHEGEVVVVVQCEHCPHSYEYVHVVMEHDVVVDEE